MLGTCITQHYEKSKGNKRYRLVINMKPVPTIFNPKKVVNKNPEINNVTSPIEIPWRTPRKRLYQEDQFELFISKDSVIDFTWLNKSVPPSGYTFSKNDDHILFYKLKESEMSIGEVTDCIRVDSELHVQPFQID